MEYVHKVQLLYITLPCMILQDECVSHSFFVEKFVIFVVCASDTSNKIVHSLPDRQVHSGNSLSV